MSTNNNNYQKSNWWFLGQLPSKNARYIVLDTETTGVSPQSNHIIEVAAIEISKGKLTGIQYHAYIKPRNPIDPRAEEKHKLGNDFYSDYFSDVYESDKETMENLLKFVGNSLVFAHNASFDYNFINNELKYWQLPSIPKNRFRCTMRIFKAIFSEVDPSYKKFCSLSKCCEYFNLKSSFSNFHSAIFDSFMAARLLCKIYEYVDLKNNLENFDDINKTNQISLIYNNVDMDDDNKKNNLDNTNFNNIISESKPKNQLIENVVDINIVDNINNINANNILTQSNEHKSDLKRTKDTKVLSVRSNLNENCDPNIIDSEVIDLNQYERFIKDYMEKDLQNTQIENSMTVEVEIQSQKKKSDNNKKAKKVVKPEEIISKQTNKYKELMRKYVNTYNKTNDINKSIEQLRDSMDDSIKIDANEIEEIIRDNL